MADLVVDVPPWQPDEEAKKCPICGQEFTLFFRKHHCRKCGKVVCGDCSRHRITVPVRYIAQPPWAIDSAIQYPTTSVPVRVCNPCVPDPWSPSENEQQSASDPRTRGSNRYSLPPSMPGAFPGSRGQRHSTDLSQPPPYSFRPDPQHGVMPARRPLPHAGSQPSLMPSRRPLPPGPTNVQGHTRTQSLDPSVITRPPISSRFTRPPPSAPPLPRREVKEEDECPVCGIELEAGEASREAHVAACVTTRFGALDTSQRLPLTPDESTGTEASSSSPTPHRLRAQSYRSRGLYQYKATEKDCVDGEGQEQECPICFEEFEAGETLGRLECLCRFHHKCIRDWWARKGPGMCPVHASHE